MMPKHDKPQRRLARDCGQNLPTIQNPVVVHREYHGTTHFGENEANSGGPRPYPFAAETPSFFCRLDDDVVYWNTSRLSGKQ